MTIMLPILLFILILAAFPIFAVARLGKSFEETMPISAMGIMLVLFIFGLFNSLGIGAIVVCIVAVLFYCYSIYCVVKTGIPKFITPGVIVFLLMTAIIAYCNKGRYATLTDEFSHWLDTVFIMARTDKFGAVPGSGAVFPSYPPAMSIFQYLLEKINMVVNHGEISEWKAYFAYQLFAVIIMLPFVKKGPSIILWFIGLVTPLYFFSQALYSLYIDPALGIMAGCGFAMVTLVGKKDWSYVTYMSMLMAVLTLSKDVGIFLSIFVSLYFAIDWISNHKGETVVRRCALAFIPMLSMIIAKMLWKLELTISHTELKFSAPFDIAGTIATIKGDGSEFNTAVYNNFLGAITNRLVRFERVGINYTAMMVLLIVLFIIFMRNLYKNERVTKATCIAGIALPSCAVVFYILSMFPLYISRFAQDEALNLASFDRYCGIVFLTGLLFVVWLLQDYTKKSVIWAIVIVALVFHSQYGPISQYLTKQSVAYSQQYREASNILAGKINANTEEDAKILLVGFDEDQPMHPIIETLTKPRKTTFSDVYVADSCEDKKDNLSLDELQNVLEDFDYVAIYRPTDNLVDNYSDIFVNSDEIQILSLYIVDADKKLRLIQ